jgi:ribosome biogenesis protein ENP2
MIYYFQGKPFTSIEPGSGLNNLCLIPNSGMIFMANEAPKILVYYIPVSLFSI